MRAAALVVHSASPPQARQLSFVGPPLPQTGVVPEQLALVLQPTHSPKASLAVSVSQKAVAPVQPPSWPTSVLLHCRQ